MESLPEFSIVFAAATLEDIRLKLVDVMKIIMLFGFLFGVVRIIGGAGQMQRGDIEGGKASIISGALIAGAVIIMRVLFTLFFPDGLSL